MDKNNREYSKHVHVEDNKEDIVLRLENDYADDLKVMDDMQEAAKTIKSLRDQLNKNVLSLHSVEKKFNLLQLKLNGAKNSINIFPELTLEQRATNKEIVDLTCRLDEEKSLVDKLLDKLHSKEVKYNNLLAALTANNLGPDTINKILSDADKLNGNI